MISIEDQFIRPESKSVSIRKILTCIDRYEWDLRLPSFQRSFVWNDDDIKRFFESIINGYPTGSILLWCPSREDVDPYSRNFIDTSSKSKSSESHYILDGQQRLTALMLLARGWKIKRGGKEISRSPLSYDPSRKDLEIYKGEKRGINLHRGVKDRLYTDIDESLRLKNELGKSGYNKFIEVVEKILDYEMPIYIVKTRNETPGILGKMANIFIMVNRAGQRISNVELLLSYAAGVFDQEITSSIRQYYDEIQSKYGEEISIQPFLRFAFSKPIAGLRQQEIENVERFKVRIEDLGSQLTVDGKRLLHEKMSSIEALNAEDKENIKKWLLLVNFNGYYSARPSMRLQRDIETVCEKGNFPFKDLLQNIQRNRPLAIKINKDNIMEGYNRDILKRPNIAYLFLLYTALVDNDASDFSGKLLKILKYDDLARHHIFPRTVLREQYNIPEEVSEEDYPIKGANGLGNITLINTTANSEIYNEKPKNYLAKYTEDILKGHFIPIEQELWNPKRFDDFADKRVELMYVFLKKQYSDIIE